MPRRTIVCLCGSTRFAEAFRKANFQETLKGHIVLTVGSMMHTDKDLEISPEQKVDLDRLHLDKIDLADEVLVLNVNDYVGASTKREVWYAQRQRRGIRMWELPTKHTPEIIRHWFVSDDDWSAAAAYAAVLAPGTSPR